MSLTSNLQSNQILTQSPNVWVQGDSNKSMGLIVTDIKNIAAAVDSIDNGGAISATTLAVSGTSTLTGAVTQKASLMLGSVVAPTYSSPYQLTLAQSGSTVIFDTAAGNAFTLPAAGTSSIGSWFDFIVLTTCTTNAHDVVCAGTDKLLGALSMGISATTPGANPGPKFFLADGTSNVKISMAAASSNVAGGVKGTQLKLTCVSATQWQVSGIVIGTGTIVTPVV